jgi:hypothetical protein
MRKHFGWLLGILLALSVTAISWKAVETKTSTKLHTSIHTSFSANELFEQYVANIYQAAHLQQSGLELSVFQKAYTGFINLKLANKLPQNSAVLTVVDLSKPSHEKRMWIINIANKELLLNTWVAHGQGSGNDMATQFSDINQSHQSSLGFYVTDDVYIGKHGRSLRLDGMDAGFNTSARSRAIVVHAANYVSPQNIAQQGRIGRSFGCPAVSPEVSELVINTIKGKTVLFINGNNSNYTSKYLNEDTVPENLFRTDSSAENIAGIAPGTKDSLSN